MLDELRELLRREPARIASLVTAGLVAAATALGIAVDEQSVGEIAVLVVTILAGGEVTRRRVSPAHRRR